MFQQEHFTEVTPSNPEVEEINNENAWQECKTALIFVSHGISHGVGHGIGYVVSNDNLFDDTMLKFFSFFFTADKSENPEIAK